MKIFNTPMLTAALSMSLALSAPVWAGDACLLDDGFGATGIV